MVQYVHVVLTIQRAALLVGLKKAHLRIGFVDTMATSDDASTEVQ